MVEHLTLNQVVLGSSPRRRTTATGHVTRRGPFVFLALLLALAAACGRGKDERLETMIAEHPVLVLISSAGVVAGADSLCDDLIEEGWESYYPDNLADRTTPERLAAGHEWLRRQIAGMPRDDREAALARLEGRVEAYVDVLSLGSFVESLAMGVALTPSLADLLPDDLNSRGADTPEEVGWTLASSEHAGLRHRLAQRLGDMQPHERAAVLRGLKENITWAEKQVEAGE